MTLHSRQTGDKDRHPPCAFMVASQKPCPTATLERHMAWTYWKGDWPNTVSQLANCHRGERAGCNGGGAWQQQPEFLWGLFLSNLRPGNQCDLWSPHYIGHSWAVLSHFTVMSNVVCAAFHRLVEVKTGVLEVLFIS